MITIHYCYCYYSRKYFLRENKIDLDGKFQKEETTNVTLLKIGRIVIWLFFAFAIYKAFLEVRLLYGNRQALFVGGMAGLEIPLVVRIATSLFQTGYLFILAAYPPRKTFILYTIVYMLTIIPGVIIGNRMMVAVMLLFIFWYLNKMYAFKLSKTKMLICGVFFIIMMQIIALSRSDDELVGAVWTLIPLFFISQSISFNILGLFIQNQHEIQYYNYPYILDSIIGGFMGATGQSLETLEVRSSLGHQLVYSLNPDYYLSGASLGTSSIAELYEFGLIGVIIGGIVFAWFIAKFDNMVNRHRLYMLFSMLFFTTIIISPRASFFPYLYDMAKDIAFFIVIYVVYSIIIKKSVSLYIFNRRQLFNIPD